MLLLRLAVIFFILFLFDKGFVKIARIRSFIAPYSVRMWENVDQKNSEYGHFSRSEAVLLNILIDLIHRRTYNLISVTPLF